MMRSGGGTATARSSRFPFTAIQWEELEHQALVYKYMISGMPIPPDLLFTIKTSLLDASLSVSSSSKLIHLHHHHHHSQHSSVGGWNCFQQMGYGSRKIDPEPGRCRRTDGKKWRCSKEAYPDSKYCERHMHRGRNRSRKPVELVNTMTTMTTSSAAANTSVPLALPLPQTAIPIPIPIPISSISTRTPYYSSSTCSHSDLSSSIPSDSHHHNHSTSISYNSNPFLYPYSSSSRPPPGNGNLSSQDHFLLESGSYSHSDKDYRNSYGHGMKEDVDEHAFFSETSGTMKGESWHLEPLTLMGSSSLAHSKQRTCSSHVQNGYSYLELQSQLGNSNTSRQQQKQDQHSYYELPLKIGKEDHEPQQKVMHHFFDEWPPNNKDSTTQLSISIPNSSHHDFFMTSHNDK